MKLILSLIAALLAVTLLILPGSMIIAPSFDMFSVPDLTLGNLGFNQISPSEIGTTPILFAPRGQDLLHGGGIGAHFKPKLMTNDWTSSMKQSEVNQMFAMMAQGIGIGSVS
jgi:hypothetical protein